jgi:hypothetical protein
VVVIGLVILYKHGIMLSNTAANRVIRKICPEEETEAKFHQNQDKHLTRSKRRFGNSFETSLKQALTLLPKATRSSPVLI